MRLARRQVIVDVVETHLRFFLEAGLAGVRADLLLRKPVEYLEGCQNSGSAWKRGIPGNESEF